MALALVTLQRAKEHLRVTDNDHDDDITQKMTDASAIIVDYLKAQADPDWTVDTVPGNVRSAVLLETAELWRFRGDDSGSIESSPSYQDGQLSTAITALLRRFRDPALA